MNNKIPKAIQLFLTFIKIGAFTFGGGYAMLPLIQKEIVEKKHWITDNDILEIVAISESTPGPIAINAATFVGFRICGFWGALFATLGVVIPSYLIILIISFVLKEFQKDIVAYAVSCNVCADNRLRRCPQRCSRKIRLQGLVSAERNFGGHFRKSQRFKQEKRRDVFRRQDIFQCREQIRISLVGV